MKEQLDIIQSYYKDIKNYKPLTLEKEQELSEIILSGKPGAQKAVDTLVRANLKFAITVARQYQGRGVALEDLIEEANAGLIKAAWKYDGKLGYRFISYAVWWIRQSILESCFRNSRTVRLPLNQVSTLNRIIKYSFEFEKDNFRMPTAIEISSSLHLPEREVEALLKLNAQAVSLDKAISSDEDDEAGTIGDLLPSYDPEETDSLHDSVQGLMKTLLNDREYRIVSSSLGMEDGIERDYDAISKEENITAERVRQIYMGAIKKLRCKTSVEILRGYLG